MIAAGQLISPKIMKNRRIKPVIRVINQSRVNPALLVPITPATVADIPRIPAMFQMLEPITVPTPRSVAPVKDAITAEPNSGSEVPTAEAVTPKIIWDMPIAPPISTMLSTNTSADFITIIKETTNTPMSATMNNNLSPA